MKLKKILESIIGVIGSLINQCPSKDEVKKLKHSPLFYSHYPDKKHKRPSPEDSIQKAQSKRPGPRHSETQIFNKPRR